LLALAERDDLIGALLGDLAVCMLQQLAHAHAISGDAFAKERSAAARTLFGQVGLLARTKRNARRARAWCSLRTRARARGAAGQVSLDVVWASLTSELIPARLGAGGGAPRAEAEPGGPGADVAAAGRRDGWSLLCFSADFLAVEEEAVNGKHLFVILARLFAALLASLPALSPQPQSRPSDADADADPPHDPALEPPAHAVLAALACAAHVAGLLGSASVTSANAARPVHAACEARALFVRYAAT
jgi:hypothetical protein